MRRVPRYPTDVLAAAAPRRQIPEVEADVDMVVEDAASGFCGAVIGWEHGGVVLEDRHARRRIFPLTPAGFLLDGVVVSLVRPARTDGARRPSRTASGSLAVAVAAARVARGSRIWVEGVHDAALVERIWGDDLRVEGVVVEPLHGLDDLPDRVADFTPSTERRLGVLVDHLVPNSKESRIVARIRSPWVTVTGHPYVDVWQAVKPAALGIDAWPSVPRGVDWKDGVAEALGVADRHALWRRVLAGVRGYGDVEVPLLRAVEELIDFVTVG